MEIGDKHTKNAFTPYPTFVKLTFNENMRNLCLCNPQYPTNAAHATDH